MSVNQYLRSSQTQVNINGTVGTEMLRDYRHAARIFVDNNFRLSPKYGFLFYVEFDFNPLVTNVSNTTAQEMGMIVKRVDLPKFSIETKTHNAYNRVNIVQNKIKYDPVTISFHDDQADNVRNFWYDYYSFYYRDSDYADATYGAISKYQSRPAFDWGYTPRPTVGYNTYNGNQPYQYIQAIRIYSLYQKNFSEYELVNPTIVSFQHGEHVNGENTATLQHEMRVQFETVKYQTGYVTESTVGGFVDLHYDNTPSPIAPEVGTAIIDNAQGGYSVASNTITDLAVTNPLYGATEPILINNTLGTGGFVSGAGATGYGLAGLLNLVSASGSSSVAGVSIPSLGSLTSGVPSLVNLQQTAIAGITSISSQAVSQLASGVVGSFASGLGTNGQAVVGLAAAAISNPSAALRTVENMALNWGLAALQTGVNQYVVNPLSSALGGYANQAGSWVNQNVVTPLGNEITGLWNDITTPSIDINAINSMPSNFLGSGPPIFTSPDLLTNPDGSINLNYGNFSSTDLFSFKGITGDTSSFNLGTGGFDSSLINTNLGGSGDLGIDPSSNSFNFSP